VTDPREGKQVHSRDRFQHGFAEPAADLLKLAEIDSVHFPLASAGQG
jgi:hypothetical protein